MTKQQRIEEFNERSGFLRICGDFVSYVLISPDVVNQSKIDDLIKELTEAKEIIEMKGITNETTAHSLIEKLKEEKNIRKLAICIANELLYYNKESAKELSVDLFEHLNAMAETILDYTNNS